MNYEDFSGIKTKIPKTIPRDKYVVADFETEGLNLKYSRPWQLSFAICSDYGIEEEYDFWLDQKDLHISPKVAQLTGFSWSYWERNKQEPRAVMELFNEVLKSSKYLIGQNWLGYDAFIFKSSYPEADDEYLERCCDTRSMGRIFKEGRNIQWSDNSNLLKFMMPALISRTYKRKKGMGVSQGVMLKEFGIPHNPTLLHDSRYDIRMTWEIFKRLRGKLKLDL